jgi:[ribosomal protein S5]-alanine N-acetyltransferase
MSQLDHYGIRSFREGDETALHQFANNRAVSINLRNSFPYPFTYIHAAKWVEMNKNVHPIPGNLAITMDDQVIGGIGITLQTDIYQMSAELGYWLGEPFWNKGIMTKSVIEMVKYAFENFRIIRIYAGVFEFNTASMRVLEKTGFHKEAIHRKAMCKNGNIYDEHLYVLLNPHSAYLFNS